MATTDGEDISPESPLAGLSYYPDDWEATRREIFERDDFTCCNCFREWHERGGSAELHAHHIVPVGQFGTHDKRNLVTLCALCHAAAHGLTPGPAVTIPREFEQFIDTDLAAVRPHPDDDILDALVIPLGAILEQMPDSAARQRLLTQPNAPAREALTKLSGSPGAGTQPSSR